MPPKKSKPSSLKDLISQYEVDDLWLNDKPIGAVTDSIILAKKFDLDHKNILRAVDKCISELSHEEKYKLSENFVENHYLAKAKGRERKVKKVDITEFGLLLLLLYINTEKARKISAEILYRFLVLKTDLIGLTEIQIEAINQHYRQQIK